MTGMSGSTGGTLLAVPLPPSEAILLYAESNAWRKIHDMVHGGIDLKDALASIKGDPLFWTREVYERVHKTTKQPQFKGKGKTKLFPRPLQSPWQPQWTKPKKGEQAPQGKGKGATPQ